MNDPHVEALIYDIEHDRTVSYEGAAPIEIERPQFRLKVEDGRTRFELKEHYATEQKARAVVDAFIEQWEFEETLETGPGQFALRFEKSEIMDRNPTPGVLSVSAHPVSWKFTVSSATGTVSRRYPKSPSEPKANIHDPDVETMHYRFTRYRKGHEELSSMAYFCLTMLEYKFRGNSREKAARHFCVATDVLNNIGRLTGDKAGKGGRGARKAVDGEGIPEDFSPGEKCFLEHAIKHLILQAARVAAPSKTDLPIVTMADLPPLSEANTPR